MDMENSMCTSNFSMILYDFIHLVGVVRNDITRFIWTLYMKSMSVRVEQCLF